MPSDSRVRRNVQIRTFGESRESITSPGSQVYQNKKKSGSLQYHGSLTAKNEWKNLPNKSTDSMSQIPAIALQWLGSKCTWQNLECLEQFQWEIIFECTLNEF